MNLLSLIIYLQEAKVNYNNSCKKILKISLGYLIRPFVFLSKILENKNSLSFLCFALLILSIVIRSSKDIGSNSAIYIEIFNRFIQGESFNNLVGNSLPLFIALSIIPANLSKIFDLSQIVTWQIFFNLLAILPAYLCHRILIRTNFSKKKIKYLSLLATFILLFPPNLILENEILVKSSYLQYLILPLVYYQLIRELDKTDHIVTAILQALAIYINPINLLIVICLEISHINKNFKASILRMGLVIFVISLIQTLSTIIFLSNPNIINQGNYIIKYNIYESFKLTIYPVILLMLIFSKEIMEDKLLKLIILSATILAIQSILDNQFLVIYHSFCLILVTILFSKIYRKINWNSHGFIIAVILIINVANHQEVFEFMIDAVLFWWLFAIILATNHQEKTKAVKRLTTIFLPKKPLEYLNLIMLTLITIWLSLFSFLSEFLWLFCATMFAILINFHQNKKRLGMASTITFFVIFSYFVSMALNSVFHSSKYPVRSQIYKLVEYYTQKTEQVAIISALASDIYPITSYLNQKSNFVNFKADLRNNKDLDYLTTKIKDSKTKLILVQNLPIINDTDCEISLIENFFKDKNFKTIFTKDFRYLTRITNQENKRTKVVFFKDNFQEQLLNSNPKLFSNDEVILDDFEVYIRKINN